MIYAYFNFLLGDIKQESSEEGLFLQKPLIYHAARV